MISTNTTLPGSYRHVYRFQTPQRCSSQKPRQVERMIKILFMIMIKNIAVNLEVNTVSRIKDYEK
ncbi:hypothetical protein ACJMK2_038176, partial [Sinanodonta woodiana]